MEQAVAAPYCSSRLADAGARVVKIERSEGDFARGYDATARGQASYFVWLNRGKESVCLDIKAPEDKALLGRLIARADVFIQNLAPGAMARAGFGSAALRERHPRLITVDISGYGEEGEYAAMKAYDLLVQAESGLAHPSICPYGAFGTKDGQLVLISIQNEREWALFCAHFLDEPELPRREGFRNNNERVANRPAVDAHIGRMFASLTREACPAKLRSANTAYGFVNDCEGLRNHPALRRVPVETPEGPVAIGAPPARLSDGARVLGAVPALGAHTASVRAEFAAA